MPQDELVALINFLTFRFFGANIPEDMMINAIKDYVATHELNSLVTDDSIKYLGDNDAKTQDHN